MAEKLGKFGDVGARIAIGANVNGQNDDGMTPLHLAVKSQNHEIIKLLLQNK